MCGPGRSCLPWIDYHAVARSLVVETHLSPRTSFGASCSPSVGGWIPAASSLCKVLENIIRFALLLESGVQKRPNPADLAG